MEFNKARVTRVIDGDTFVGDLITPMPHINGTMTLHDRKFRLMGIDTPERNKPLFYEATEYAAELIDGKTVQIFVYEKDNFGRWLVDVFLDGETETLNQKLLSEGLAKVYKK